MNDIEFIDIETHAKGFLEPVPAIKKIPSWYKKLSPIKKVIDKIGHPNDGVDFTVKKCIPVLDAFTSGYFLVTKYDMIWSLDEDGGHLCSFPNVDINDSNKPISMHPWGQLGNFDVGNIYEEYAYKFSSPFVIKTPPGYSCIMTHPFNQISPFLTLTGVVDTDSHPLAVQFPFLMSKDWEGTIPKGTPIVQIIPFLREDWSMYNVSPDNLDMQENSKGMEEFNKSRYGVNGELIGGKYRKDHRVKKRYR
jgi:hypothetical protein